jgi:hypothetical protein
MDGRTRPDLWEKAKKEALQKMGGLHSARAMQLAGKIYRDMGGGYTRTKTDAQKSLTKWTKEQWRTKSGLPSLETGERYLPTAAIKSLSAAEYGATSRVKRAGMKKGKQYVKQPKSIIDKLKLN